MTAQAPPPAGSRLPGVVRAVTSGLLAAAGVAGLLLLSGGEAWGWWWLAATCLAAMIVRGDRSGVLAALLGALATSMVCAGPSLEGSGTPEGQPAWIALSIVAAVVATAAALGLSLVVAKVVAAAVPPERTRRALLAVLGLLLAATALTAIWPAGS